MDFNFVDPTEDEDEEFLDLSDLYEEDDKEPDSFEVAGMDVSFEDDVPEAMSITDPEVKRRARKARKKKSKTSSDPMMVGVKHKPYIHGMCKTIRNPQGELLAAHHETCKLYEKWNIQANLICSCPECAHPTTMEELVNGKDASKTTKEPRGQRVQSEPKSLQGSSDEGFVLVID